MSENGINFDDKKINKSRFYKNKKSLGLDNIDVNKILVSKKELYGTKNSHKYFIGYNDGDIIRPLCILLPKMIVFVKHFDSNQTRSFKVSDNKMLKKYKKIWEKVANLLTIKFDSEPIYGDVDQYIKTKIKTYCDRGDTNFHGQKVRKENATYKYKSLIMLDSVIRVNKKYYPQTLLEECIYAMKKNKMENLINHDLTLSSSDDSDNKSNNESVNESVNESGKLFFNNDEYSD